MTGATRIAGLDDDDVDSDDASVSSSDGEQTSSLKSKPIGKVMAPRPLRMRNGVQVKEPGSSGGSRGPLRRRPSRGMNPVLSCALFFLIIAVVWNFFASWSRGRIEKAMAIQNAAAKGNIQEVKELLETGVYIDAVGGPRSISALHRAAMRGQSDMVAFLLARRADVNLTAENGMTALHYAAREGHVQVAEVVLNANSSIDTRDQNEWTPLHWAAVYEQKGVVTLLMERRAPLDASAGGFDRDGDGIDDEQNTPYLLAYQNRHYKLAKVIEDEMKKQEKEKEVESEKLETEDALP